MYVDNSNVFIEGKRAKAVANGAAMNIHDAMRTGILEQSYKIDFGKLHDFIAGIGTMIGGICESPLTMRAIVGFAGDGDFVPPVRELVKEGFKCRGCLLVTWLN